MMALVHNDLPILLDPIFNTIFSAYTLNDGNIDDAGPLLSSSSSYPAD
jgi:hypothetical protein